MPQQDSAPAGQPGRASPTSRTRAATGTHRDSPHATEAAHSSTASPAGGGQAGTPEPLPDGAGQGHRGPWSRAERYLVAVAPPVTARDLSSQLRQDPAISVLRTIARSRDGGSGYPQIVVAETTADRAAALARLPGVVVESDHRLGWHHPPGAGLSEIVDPAVGSVGEMVQVGVEVLNDAGRPVADATVCLTGASMPAIGFTGPDGRVELAVPAETAADADMLSVWPARGCWPARVIRPRLEMGTPASVICERVITTFPGFPERALDSWGARAMGFDRLPPTHRGNGIKIAVVGSGAAAGHPDLADRIADGRDVVGEDDKSWRDDAVGTGTHCAVLIGGRDDGTGVVGLAPETEMHICRTAPGGHCADLIEALDYCIDQAIDVALISAGTTQPSGLLAGKVAEAVRHGVACVAAAGDGGGPVGYPAALPGVLSVGALGWLGAFPSGSGFASQLAGPPTPDGFFVPRFSSHGPGVDCCAPGLAIVSGLPPASYGPLGGTAPAAAHVAAVAALVLAHHPQFRPGPGQPPVIRDASRVHRLFQLILSSCRPVPGTASSGAGIPDAAVAVGVAPREGYRPLQWLSASAPHVGASRPDIAAGPSPIRQPQASGQAGGSTQASYPMAALAAAMRSAGLLPGA